MRNIALRGVRMSTDKRVRVFERVVDDRRDRLFIVQTQITPRKMAEAEDRIAAYKGVRVRGQRDTHEFGIDPLNLVERQIDRQCAQLIHRGRRLVAFKKVSRRIVRHGQPFKIAEP